jgi:hypothetical protein
VRSAQFGLGSDLLNYGNQIDLAMVEEAVYGEPFSGPNSLPAGNSAGNFP